MLTIEEIFAAHPEIIVEMRKLDPIRTAASFASLLLMPELQANCLRLEALVHLAVAYCEGHAAPTKAFVKRWFQRLGQGFCGAMEDPAEDVFVTLVNSPQGNFRILEGIREGAGFHLQRVLGVLETMPQQAPYTGIRDSVRSMLVLSDEIAERAKLCENLLGGELPLESLPRGIADALSRCRELIRFSEEDFARLGIATESLSDFEFDPGGRAELAAQRIGHTDIERRPVASRGDSTYLLLPTAVASAVTRFVVESLLSMGGAEALERALCSEYAELFDGTPILGGPTGAPFAFQKIPGGRISSVASKTDTGRLLYLVFFVDGLEGFMKDGLSGTNADPKALGSAVSENLRRAAAEASKDAGFVDGICLLVGCGLGRNIILEVDEKPPDRWRLETISAYDLVTLSWLPGIDQLYLWRLLDSLEAVEREGAALLNVNGLLNLAAWSQQLDGHLVPHANLPDGSVDPSAQAFIAVQQNALRELRHRVLTEWNPRRVLDPDGRWVRVRKTTSSEFQEDRAAPLYASEDDVRGRKLRGVYVAPNRPWWVGITAPEGTAPDAEFRRWEMLCMWLARGAPILDRAYAHLPSGPVAFEVIFEEVVGIVRGPVRPKNADELRPLVQVSAEEGCSTIRINVARGFDDGLIQPENVAERLLVEALVAGAAAAGGEIADTHKREGLLSRICPNLEARFEHRFQARSFRDWVSSETREHPEFVHPLDEGTLRIGLGWRVWSRERGANISGVGECTACLNDVVRAVLDDLCAELKCLDRSSFVRSVLNNYELAAHDRDLWSRTSQANMALHEDKAAALRTIVTHQGRLNACFTASRILLEAAICECPLDSGRSPGRLDLSRLMCQILAAHHYGGWSDAIHWGAMEPRLRITPLGDVHMKPSYIDEVYEPYGQLGGEREVRRAAKSYTTLHEPERARPSIAEVVEPEFAAAWIAEFGASLDAVRAFVDHIEHLGEKPPRPILELPRSALSAALASAAGISLDDASATVDALLSKPRAEWRTVGREFAPRDWYPWRFRRRLSILRRPLIQIDEGDDPVVFVAPGLLREAFAATVSWFHGGEISSVQAKSGPMIKWIGHANNVQRREFNSIVAGRMRELGWSAESEVRLTKILRQSLDRDYGDVDVLAWRAESGRVLAIECKDVQFPKTLGEVAEQLADFRGEIRPDRRPDHLKRHLNRLEVLALHESAVAKALKLTLPIQIEGHLVFRNPVPMQFAWDHMAKRIRLSLFDQLDRL